MSTAISTARSASNGVPTDQSWTAQETPSAEDMSNAPGGEPDVTSTVLEVEPPIEASASTELNDQSTSAIEETKEEEKDDNDVVLTDTVIIGIAEDYGITVFRNQYGDSFAAIPVQEQSPAVKCLRIRSEAFKAALLDIIFRKTKKLPRQRHLAEAVRTLQLKSHIAERCELSNRFCSGDDTVLIDLGDDSWEMISISANKEWEILGHKTPCFYRFNHQRPLPRPVAGGSIDDIFKFLPIRDDSQQLLMTSWMVSAIDPRIPTPMLLLLGEQGAGKSTSTRRIRNLIDPSETELLGDVDQSNLFRTFQSHAVPAFENVSQISRLGADMFCRAVTGTGVERRQLFTDAEQVLFRYRRPIIINGISLPSDRSDFLDRCLVFNLERFDKFQTLQDLDRMFEAAHPKLFGALLNLLSAALAAVPSTPPADEFRMADFATFGRTVTTALGKNWEEFDKAYRENIEHLNGEVLEGFPRIRLLKKAAQGSSEQNPYEPTADELLTKLRSIAKDTGDALAERDLPKSARWLSTWLSEMSCLLATYGIIVIKLPRTNSKRRWKMFTTESSTVRDTTDALNQDKNGGTNDE